MKPSMKKPQAVAATCSSRAAWVLFVVLLLMESTAIRSFVHHVIPNGFCTQNQQTIRGNIHLFSVLDDDNTSSSDKVDFDDFNPLSYKASKNKNTVAYNFSATQISIRKTRMQELNNELLNAAGDKEKTQEVLQENKDFLLETLEDSEAVLDPDSVYTPGMSRDERYQVYRESMDKRLEAARNPQVKWILQSMRDFVLGFQ